MLTRVRAPVATRSQSVKVPRLVPGKSRHLNRLHMVHASSGEERSVPVGNAFWKLSPMDALFYNILGETFVIRRGEGESSSSANKARLSHLLRKARNGSIVPRPVNPPPSAAVHHKQDPSPPLMPLSILDLTDLLTPLNSSKQQQQQRGADDIKDPPQPPTPNNVTAMAAPPQTLFNLHKTEEEAYAAGETSTSPRRTVKCGFTCQRCNTRTYRMINPRSFSDGTLVVQCSNTKCLEWHKLADHLGLFGEPTGYPEGLTLPLPPFYWRE